MSNLPNHLPLPLAGFVRRLRAAGFAVDAGREFQLRRVLHEQGAYYIGRFGDLKYALAPYVATNAGEQKRFYRLWDDYVVSLEAQLVDKAEDALPAGWRKWAQQLRYLLMVIGALLLAFLVKELIKVGPTDDPSPVRVELLQEAEARAGQALEVQNATLLEEARDSVGFGWEVRDVETGVSLHRQDSFNLNYIIPDTLTGRSLKVILWAQELESDIQLSVDSLTLAVLCGNPPQVPSLSSLPRGVVKGESWQLPKLESRYPLNKKPAKGDAKEESEVVFWWLINGERLEETPEEYVFSEEGQTRIQLLIQQADDPDHCFSLSPVLTVQVGSDVPIIPIIPLQRDTARQILKASSWLYLLPILFGLWAYWLHRRKWKKKEETTREKTDDELAEEYPFHDVGPYVIPYQDQTGQITVPADFYRIADQLRVREAGLRMSFDGKATVEATVREGGFPSWRERAVKRPANYLVLLRHTDEFHQQDRLLKRLTDFLLAREAELDVYYHGGDFTWFWNEAHPQGWSPAQMTGRYGEHRLIILGDGHGLVDAFHRREPRLEPTKERWLMKWSRRLLLTTEPAVDWSFQEVLLHKDLLLYPATTNGILRGVADLNQVEEYQGGSYTRWKAERFRRNPEPSHRYRTWATVADHRDYLANDPDLFRWLTALSVAPNPNWSLTIAIGRGLGLDITHDRLLQLSRIPWLAANAPDQDMRLAFLAELSFADEQLARAAALEQLEAVSGEVENTFAESEWTANLAVQTFALAPLETGNQAKIRDLRRMGMLPPDQLAELNQVAERQFPATKGGPSQIGDEFFLDELLSPPVKAGEILNAREKELLGLILVCLLMFLPMYLYNKAGNELLPGESKSIWQKLENPTDDAHRALEANNRAVLQADYLARNKNYSEYNKRYLEVDLRILGALDTALGLKPDYPLADSNSTKYHLNNLSYTLNWLVKDSLMLQPVVLEATDQRLAFLRAHTDSLYGMSSPYALQARHMDGLYSWYRYKQGSTGDVEKNPVANDRLRTARFLSASIDSIDADYFELLADSMPIHLKYLLEKEPKELIDFGGRVYTGRVVDQEGKAFSAVDIILAGTQRSSTVSVNGGEFRIAAQLAEGTLLFSYQNGPVKEVSLLGANGLPLESTGLGQVVLARPNVPSSADDPSQTASGPPITTEQEQGTPPPGGEDNSSVLEGIIDGFGDYRYSRTLRQTGTMEENIAFANQMANSLNERRLLRPIVKGDDLITSGIRVTNGGSHEESGNFLFIKSRLSPGPLGDNLDRLHRESRALVIIGTDFAENSTPLSNLTEVGAASNQFARALAVNGFEVTTLKDPTVSALESAMEELAAADYTPMAQLVVYLSGYIDDTRLIVKDGFGGVTDDGIFEDVLGYSLSDLDEKVPHLLVIKNYTEVPVSPIVAGNGEAILPNMANVSGGTFEMGDTFEEGYESEKPVHSVTVSPFEMGRYEVTFAEYDRFTEASGKTEAEADFGRGQQPVINVSWFDAISYCNWLSMQAGYRPVYALAALEKQNQWEASGYGLELDDEEAVVIDWTADGYRLPTEAEWEFAASYVDGKRKARFGNGRDTLRPAEANFNAGADYKKAYSQAGEYRERTVAVGSLNSANALGIHDLAGNVLEWCSDWYDDNYGKEEATRNPYGPGTGTYRVLRGGSWILNPVYCRAAGRIRDRPRYRDGIIGFRLVRSPRE